MFKEKKFPSFLIRRKALLILLIIFVLALFLRLYNLDQFPSGFHIDEASLGYNGYSLLLTGKDENNKPFPLYVDMFGDNRPSGYHYLTALPIKFLGLTEVTTRLPGAVFGSLTVFAIYLLALTVFKERKISWLSSLLLAISPWHIVLSRASSEAVVAIFFIILGITLLVNSLEGKRRLILVSGTILLVTSFFFYHTPRVFVPLLFLSFLIFLFPRWCKRELSYRVGLICSFVLVSFFAWCLVFAMAGGTGRFSQVNIFGFPETKLVMEEQIREDGVGKTGIITTRFFHNKVVNYSLTFVKNYFDYFGGEFLFVKGGLPFWYNVPNMGLLYLIELPFLLLGVILLAAQKDKMFKLPLVWLFLSPLTASLTVDDIPNINRALVMLPAFELIIAFGIFGVLNKIPFRFKLAGIILISTFFLYNFSYFLHQYFVHAPIHQNWYRHEGMGEMMKIVKASYATVDKVIVTKTTGGIYPLILFYMKYDPKIYQAEGSAKDRDYSGFGKFFFVPQACPSQEKDERFPKEKKILYVEKGECEGDGNWQKVIYRQDSTRAFHLVL